MKKNESNTAKLNSNFTGMMAVVMLSILFLVIGIVMYVYPQMELKNFTYVICGFFLVGGACEVARYFLKEEYRNVANYDFSAGILLLVLGVLLIVKEPSFTSRIYLLLGALVLGQGIVLVQYFIDMIALKSPLWGLMLVLAIAEVVLSVCILLDAGGWFTDGSFVLYGSLFISGIIGLISLFLVALRIRRFEELIKREKLRDLEDDFTDFVPNNKKDIVAETKKDEKEDIFEDPVVEEEKDTSTVDEDVFEDEGIKDDEPETNAQTLKDKILSLKSKRKKQEIDDSIFEDEDAM
ncbi:MAG: DUF308 domain-containing protein [Lachnospiraceae bacterium]|nr:DUF308 domain-containing protein [Lachnospiraceae bacterium]